ncbi:MAG: prepilin-type N-terminal cleavage/methylation domain-containing protein [Halopseudomonas sp.]|uniref:prepilin-type N-terminal cleavage/methylation domain-containing protein n=1 Tax=Halopseudomonas sp. TaxID=2901191 RepID=UPI0030037612
MRHCSCYQHIDKRRRGFTLAELLMAVAVLGLIAAIALPSYYRYVERTKIALASVDIVTISGAIEVYRVVNRSLPNSLAQLGNVPLLDPWENPYQYLSFAGLKGKGKMRKDKNLVPVNSDYDLYSMGKDGRTNAPFTAQASRDDIVRANDGGYVGPVSDY